jgi:hypothetical protein
MTNSTTSVYASWAEQLANNERRRRNRKATSQPSYLHQPDKACTCEIEILSEYVVDDLRSSGHFVRWLGRSGDNYASVAALVDDWNNLELREMARREAKLAFRLHFNRKETA